MAILDEAAKTLDLIVTGGKRAAKAAKAAKKAASPLKGMKPGAELDLGGMKIPPPRQGPLAVDSTLGLPEDMQMPVTFEGKDVADFTPEDFGRFGRQYGVENLGPDKTFHGWKGDLIHRPLNGSGRHQRWR